VAREHPDGSDFLAVNAGIADVEHKSGIETCAVRVLAMHTIVARHAITRSFLNGSDVIALSLRSLLVAFASLVCAGSMCHHSIVTPLAHAYSLSMLLLAHALCGTAILPCRAAQTMSSPALPSRPCCPGRDPADLERIVSTNVFGAFATVQAFYLLLKVRRSRVTSMQQKCSICIPGPR